MEDMQRSQEKERKQEKNELERELVLLSCENEQLESRVSDYKKHISQLEETFTENVMKQEKNHEFFMIEEVEKSKGLSQNLEKREVRFGSDFQALIDRMERRLGAQKKELGEMKKSFEEVTQELAVTQKEMIAKTVKIGKIINMVW